MSEEKVETHTEAAGRKRLPRWTKVLLAVAVGLMLGGGLLRAWPAAAPAPQAAPHAPAARRSLAPGAAGAPAGSPAGSPRAPGEAGAPGEDELARWSGPVFRLGLGFAAGFAVAWALRAMFKLALVAIGVIVAALVGLQYAGLVALDWTAISGHYDSLSAWLAGQFSSFQRLVTGYLPTGGSAGLGLLTGFRRR